MKKYAGLTALVTVPFIIAACGAENNENEAGNNTEPAEENAAENNNEEEMNEENNEAAEGGEVEELADEYGLSVTVEEGEGDAPEASLEELEEAFELISTAQEADMLEFQESPEAGEIEESGTAVGEYGVPGVEADGHVEVSFSYEMGGDLEDESRIPSFEDISDVETAFEGAEFLDWEEETTESDITGAGTIAEFTSEGTWELLASYEDSEVSLSEDDTWMAEFSSDILAGVEEEE
jgi:hypothetical protein